MLILAIGLMLTSCATLGAVNEVITPSTTLQTTAVAPISTTDTSITTTTRTSVTPLTINTKEDLLKATTYLYYPYEISFNNYLVGIKIQTWTQDDKTPVFGHNAGDVMCIDIYNANDYNTVFSLEYENIYSPSTFEDGSTVYQPEPDAVNWVDIKNPTITLLPHQLLGVPISLDVPAETICPPNWEFRITVTDVTDEAMICENYQVRCLVNMMKPTP